MELKRNKLHLLMIFWCFLGSSCFSWPVSSIKSYPLNFTARGSVIKSSHTFILNYSCRSALDTEPGHITFYDLFTTKGKKNQNSGLNSGNTDNLCVYSEILWATSCPEIHSRRIMTAALQRNACLDTMELKRRDTCSCVSSRSVWPSKRRQNKSDHSVTLAKRSIIDLFQVIDPLWCS